MVILIYLFYLYDDTNEPLVLAFGVFIKGIHTSECLMPMSGIFTVGIQIFVIKLIKLTSSKITVLWAWVRVLPSVKTQFLLANFLSPLLQFLFTRFAEERFRLQFSSQILSQVFPSGLHECTLKLCDNFFHGWSSFAILYSIMIVVFP